jgi:hypothetical protein
MNNLPTTTQLLQRCNHPRCEHIVDGFLCGEKWNSAGFNDPCTETWDCPVGRELPEDSTDGKGER